MAWVAKSYKHISTVRQGWIAGITLDIDCGVYKQGKVRTMMMLRESRDESIRSNPPEVTTARNWDAARETDDTLAELDHRDVGAAQSDRAGLWVNPCKPFGSMNPA